MARGICMNLKSPAVFEVFPLSVVPRASFKESKRTSLVLDWSQLCSMSSNESKRTSLVPD